MLQRTQYGETTWIDAISPTVEEMRSLMHEYALDPGTAEELLSPNIQQGCAQRGEYFLLVLHVPTIKHSHDEHTFQELDLVIGERVLVSVHYGTIDALLHFAKVFEVSTMLQKDDAPVTPPMLLAGMLERVYGSVGHELDFQSRTLHEIEKNIFDGKEQEMVRTISETGRALLSIKQILAPQNKLLQTLRDALRTRCGLAANTKLALAHEECVRQLERAQEELEILRELRETNDSLVQTKQNEVMKILTVLAFITLPLSLIAGIFNMNTTTMPLVGVQGDFWIIIGMMFTGTIIMFAYFKYKRWL